MAPRRRLTGRAAPVDAVSPYANAVLLLSALHNALAALYRDGWFDSPGRNAYLLGCLGSASFAFFGLWCLLFAGDKSRISKYHRLDKDTSSFPFTNRGAYSSKKKAL